MFACISCVVGLPSIQHSIRLVGENSDEVTIHGYVYEVESDTLRRPSERVTEQIYTRVSE